MKESIVPQTFEEWRHCIVVECGLELTAEFIDKRITCLQKTSEYHTQEFIRLYGQQHHQRVLSWFSQVQEKQ